MITLNVKPRAKSDSLLSIRKQGGVPAVFYGRGQETVPIILDEKEFIKVYHQAGESTVITLKTGKEDFSALVQDYHLHPVTHKVMHVDFKIVKANEKIEVNIPLEFIGEAPVEMGDVGTITKVLHEITVESLPKDLPQNLEVDLSVLVNIGDAIYAKDIKLPKNVTLVNDPEEVVVVTSGVSEEEESETPTEIDFSAIKTDKDDKKKDEEESAE